METVTDWLLLAMSLAVGLALSLVHFAGLWVTVRRIPTSSSPALLLLGSGIGRTVFTFTGFYLVASVDSHQLPFCLVAFFVARLALMRRLGSQRAPASKGWRLPWN